MEVRCRRCFFLIFCIRLRLLWLGCCVKMDDKFICARSFQRIFIRFYFAPTSLAAKFIGEIEMKSFVRRMARVVVIFVLCIAGEMAAGYTLAAMFICIWKTWMFVNGLSIKENRPARNVYRKGTKKGHVTDSNYTAITVVSLPCGWDSHVFPNCVTGQYFTTVKIANFGGRSSGFVHLKDWRNMISFTVIV